MQLISRTMYESIYYPRKDIIIQPYSRSLFSDSYCYFRLGGIVKNGTVVPMTEQVKILKHEIKHVFSLETFTISDRAFAILGPCTELMINGLFLHNSPSIDPGFSGSLEIFIENYTNETILLEPGMKIGKAILFNISDSILEFSDSKERKQQRSEWTSRKAAGDKIREAEIWIEKKIDTETPKDS